MHQSPSGQAQSVNAVVSNAEVAHFRSSWWELGVVCRGEK